MLPVQDREHRVGMYGRKALVGRTDRFACDHSSPPHIVLYWYLTSEITTAVHSRAAVSTTVHGRNTGAVHSRQESGA